jgi:putative ABC transport system permease protein
MRGGSDPSFFLAQRGLIRNLRRNIITGATIAVGYAGLVLLGSYIYRTHQYLKANTIYVTHTGHFSIFSRGALDSYFSKPKTYSLSVEKQKLLTQKIKDNLQVEFVAPYLWGQGLVSNGCRSFPFYALGIDTGAERKIQNHPWVKGWIGELLEPKKGLGIWNYSQAGIVPFSITGELAKHLSKQKVLSEFPAQSKVSIPDCTLEDNNEQFSMDSNIQLAAKTYEGAFSAIDGEIVAHHSTGYAMTEDTGLSLPIESLQKLLDTENVTYLAVYLSPESNVNKAIAILKKNLGKIEDEYDFVPYDDDRIGLFYAGTMNFLYIMGAFFAFLIALVVIVSIINTINMALIERSAEFGTFRLIGFRPSQVKSILVIEAAVLSTLSILVGAVLSKITIYTVNRMNFYFDPPGIAGLMPFKLAISWTLLAGIGLLMLFFSYLTAYFSLRKRLEVPMLDLLKYSQNA